MNIKMLKTAFTGLILLGLLSSQAFGEAIIVGFNANTLSGNDDGSVGPVNIGFNIDFFGVLSNQLFVNNNGNVTLDSALSTFTPFDLTSTGRQIIAPFFSDVDTSAAGSPVTYGVGMYGGFAAFGVNWLDVDYYSSSTTHSNRNSFQLLLVDRSDVTAGDFDIIFNYDQVQWDSGQASGGGSNGLGGDSAHAGYSNGTGNAGSFFELTGSAVNGAFLDGGSNALISNRLNSDTDGRYVFNARNGAISSAPIQAPEPSTLVIFALGIMGLAVRRFKKYS